MTNWKLDWKPLNEQDIRLIREVTGIVEQTNIGCRSCGGNRNGNLISSLAPICPTSNKNVGDIVHMSATPTGGTAPYTVSFRKGNPVDATAMLLKQFTGATEGQEVTYDYTILSTDAGAAHTLSVNTIDSCSVGAKFCNEQCSVTVNAIVVCNVPTCNLIVT